MIDLTTIDILWLTAASIFDAPTISVGPALLRWRPRCPADVEEIPETEVMDVLLFLKTAIIDRTDAPMRRPNLALVAGTGT